MTIELYVFPPSPRAFKAMAVANHLGLDYEIRFLDLPKGTHKTPQYAALNPNMRMPTLKDGDYVLWESNAIQQYLAGKKPDAGLLPRDERARLDVTRWQFWDLAHWDPTCALFAFEYVAKPLFRGIKEPTLADFSLGSVMNFAEMAHYPIEPYGEIKRWYATLRALPAWQKTLGQSALPAATAA